MAGAVVVEAAVSKLTFGSLFSGIGGFDLGFEQAGMECRWQVEIDDKARAVLDNHWPGVAKYGDVRNVGKHNLEPVDVICGGFPCQDLSVAGKRGGLAGERSGLWFEFYRVVKELKPRFVVIENVPNLLAINNGRDFETILLGLAQIGYDAEWQVLSASSFGAPHQRQRLFLVAFTRGLIGDYSFFVDGFDGFPRNKQWDTTKNIKSGSGWKRWLIKASNAMDGQITSTDFLRMDDGISEGVDRIKQLGNAVAVPVVRWIGERIVAAEG